MPSMPMTRMGHTGTQVSRICLGTMSYAEPGSTHQWSLDEKQSRPFFERALELGINFFDTAEYYGNGSSEEYLGRALHDLRPDREDVVIATKVFMGTKGRRTNAQGLSRKHILYECEQSLRRLQTDYIDLYLIHRFDPHTPMEETLSALTDLVRRGWVRHIGASSMHAWQFAKYLHLAEIHGFERFAIMQNHYNLMYREEEREMIPLCIDQHVGLTPWSPLARGRLARTTDDPTPRAQSDPFGDRLYTDANDEEIIRRNREVAKRLGVSPACCALAWLLAKPGVTAPILGATKPEHLNEAVAALDLVLDPNDVAALEAPYRPHPVAGIS